VGIDLASKTKKSTTYYGAVWCPINTALKIRGWVKYPWNSVYALSDNRVIDGVELEGLECKEFNSESALEIYCSANPL